MSGRSCLLLEERLILPVDLDVDGLRDAPGQVADVVLDELAEVRVNGGLRGRDSAAQIVDHFVERTALAAGLQADDVVAPIRLRDEEAELGARSARIGGDVREREDDLLDSIERLICFGQ